MEGRPAVDLEELSDLSEATSEETIDMDKQPASPLATRKRLEALLEERRLRKELREYDDL